jgi:hypothetical protein
MQNECVCAIGRKGFPLRGVSNHWYRDGAGLSADVSLSPCVLAENNKVAVFAFDISESLLT